MIKHQTGAPQLRGLTKEDDFQVSWDITAVETPAIDGTDVSRDIIYSIYTYPSSQFTYDIKVNFPLNQTDFSIQKISGNSNLVGNLLTCIGSGSSTFEVKCLYGTRRYTVPNMTGGYVINTPVPYQFVNDSLANHITSNVINLFSGKPSNQSAVNRWVDPVYSENASGCSATKNPDAAAFSLDTSWISFLRSNGPGDKNPGFPCALISKRHIVVANHVGLPYKVIFRRNNGSFIEANILSGVNVSALGDSKSYWDLRIGYLDRDISGIDPVLFFPSKGINSLKNKFGMVNPQPDTLYRVPALISLNNDSNNSDDYKPSNGARYFGGPKIMACDLFGLSNIDFKQYTAFFKESKHFNLKNFFYTPYSGDSSSMVFVPVMQSGVMKCVLISSLWHAGDGPDYSAFSEQIDLQMRNLASARGDNFTYSLSYADLSSFPTYSE